MTIGNGSGSNEPWRDPYGPTPYQPGAPIYPSTAGSPYGITNPAPGYPGPSSANLGPSLVPSPYGYQILPQHPYGTGSMVTGIISLVFGLLCGIGLIGSPVALLLAVSGRRQMREQPARWAQTGTLTAGLVLGVIGTVMLGITVIMLMIWAVTVLPHRY